MARGLEIKPLPMWAEEKLDIRRALIYCRVSDDKRKGRSVAEQEKMSRATCERNSWTIHEHIFIDNSISASRYSRKTRPEFEALLKEIRPGDVVVMWADNRAHRNMDTFVELRKILAEKGAYWCYGGQVYDMRKGKDRTRATQDAAKSEAYSEELKENVQRAILDNVRDGKPHGKNPFGYRICRDEDGNQEPRFLDDGSAWYWEAHPKEAPIARKMMELFLDGKSLHAIARYLDEHEMRTRSGTVFSYTGVRDILKNPTYTAHRVYKGEVRTEGQWEPLWSVEDHLAAKELLAGRPDYSKMARPGRPSAHLLSGIAVCGICGSQRMQVTPHTSRHGKRTHRYRCNAAQGKSIKGGFHLTRGKEWVDQYVIKSLLAYISDEEFIAEQRAKTDDTDYDAYRQQAEEKEAYLKSYREAAMDPSSGITPQFLGDLTKRLEPEINALYALSRPPVRNARLEELIEAPDKEAYWDELGIEEQRSLVADVFVVTFLPVGRGRSADFPEYVEVKWVGVL